MYPIYQLGIPEVIQYLRVGSDVASSDLGTHRRLGRNATRVLSFRFGNDKLKRDSFRNMKFIRLDLDEIRTAMTS
jgi:hypothetical protein